MILDSQQLPDARFQPSAVRVPGSGIADQDCSNVSPIAALLWKDADPEIPILKQAKAEYTNLR
jgi:hypothetical protein